ncbi:MAG: SusC/RagA family TonB-linked outer membrane protein [Sphingobacteriaceae bacterium]|nr:SusC/RagA family TonB-linked outer membrane protein [Sphingobacteriaceae bacterium]
MRRNLYAAKLLVILLCVLPELLFSQAKQIQVRGVVIDRNTSDPVPGVTVALDVKPPKPLAVTDAMGRFTITVSEGANLIFRYVGYTDRKVKLEAKQTMINVSLTESVSIMNEVVIRGYTKRTREESGGSSYIITDKDIKDLPVSNVEQLLQGKVAGLNIQVNTGAPGYRGTVALRGVSGMDISGTTGEDAFLTPYSPLYVIDNIPVEADANSDFGFNTPGPGVSPLSLIPPEDIASIEILKDVQATSQYGSRGAYGVILITTRRGNSPKPRFRYSSKFFVNTPPKLRETIGGRAERLAKINEIYAMGTYNDRLKITEIPMLSDSLSSYYNNSTDWQSVYYGSTFNTTHNLGIDGGDNKFNYKTNFGYYKEKGIIKNTGFDRYSLSMLLEYRPTDDFWVNFTVASGIGKKNKGNGLGILQTGAASNSAASSLLPGPSLFQASTSVLADMSVENNNLSKNIRPSMNLSYSFIPGLRLTATGSYDYAVGTEETNTPALATTDLRAISYALNERSSNLYGRGGFTYAKSFNGSDHNFFLNTFSEVGIKAYQVNYSRLVQTANDQLTGPLGSSPFRSRGGGVLINPKRPLDERSVSYSSGFSYNFRKKYILDLTYRLDASSISGFDSPFAKNYAGALKWNFGKEKLFEDSKWLSSGALRLSSGKNVRPTGNVYSLYGVYRPAGDYEGTPIIGIDYQTIPNNKLKPTTKKDLNIGLDLSLFKNRYQFIFDTYRSAVTNLQRTIALPSTTGFVEVLSNDAGLINYGYELTVIARPLPNNSKINWIINANAALNNDFVTSLPGNKNQILQSNSIVTRVGRNTFSNFLLKNEGVYRNTGDVPIDPVTGLPLRTPVNATAFFKEGDPIWQDTNGDYIIDDKDKQVLGNSQPKVTGGLGSTIIYKAFSFTVNASFTLKRDILNAALASRLALVKDPFGRSVYLPLDDVNYWKQSGDISEFPNPFDFNRAAAINPFRVDQSLFQEDGSYFKINSVALGYTVNKNRISKLGLRNIRFHISANNLITFSPYSGPSPENVSGLGWDQSNGYPVSRTYNFGCDIDF